MTGRVGTSTGQHRIQANLRLTGRPINHAGTIADTSNPAQLRRAANAGALAGFEA
jgi:hypothetical protein